MKAVGIRSEPFFSRRLAFLICEVKAPTSLTAETLQLCPLLRPYAQDLGSDLGKTASGLCAPIPHQ